MATNVSGERTPELIRLVEVLRRTVQREQSPEETATAVCLDLEPFLGRADLLTDAQQEPDPRQYTQHVLHVEEDGSFSVVALVWLSQQRTPIHDHVSWCVVGVHSGEETEVRFDVHADADERYLTEEQTSVNHHRSICAVTPPGDIHMVMNTGAEKAISIHVYGADIGRLGSSIRRRYTLPIREPAQ